MTRVIADKLHQVTRLCREFDVARLEVFGSAAEDSRDSGGAFDPSRSDIDLIVTFEADVDLGPWLAHYFEFKTAMEQLLGRPVDLVMNHAFRNAVFADAVERSRRLLYAA